MLSKNLENSISYGIFYKFSETSSSLLHLTHFWGVEGRPPPRPRDFATDCLHMLIAFILVTVLCTTHLFCVFDRFSKCLFRV